METDLSFRDSGAMVALATCQENTAFTMLHLLKGLERSMLVNNPRSRSAWVACSNFSGMADMNLHVKIECFKCLEKRPQSY